MLLLQLWWTALLVVLALAGVVLPLTSLRDRLVLRRTAAPRAWSPEVAG